MTKKDYLTIGKAIRKAEENAELTLTYGPFELVASYIADAFAADNPSFDRARFLRFAETGKDTKGADDA